MLALAALPLFGFVGAAIDYSRAASVRTSLQSAADATGLMLSKDASSLNPADLQTKAGNYLKTLFTNGDHNDVSVTTTYDTGAGGSQILLKASTSVNTRYMGISASRRSGYRSRPTSSGATSGCAWPWYWTTPARCRRQASSRP
jgi:hypothetical protein